MPSKKRKSDVFEVLASGNAKKSKIVPVDPFGDKYSEVNLEIFNTPLDKIFEILCTNFDEGTPRFEIKTYKSVLSGYSKTLCGETRFQEEFQVLVTIVFETEKKDQMESFIKARLPDCTYIFK